MTDESLYNILGVGKDATQEEIKAAYRKRAQQTHPDKNNGDDTEFKRVRHAYEVLRDPARRKEYDETGNVEPDNKREQVDGMVNGLFALILGEMIAKQYNGEEIVSRAISSARQGIDELRRAILSAEGTARSLDGMFDRVKVEDGIENAWFNQVKQAKTVAEREISNLKDRLDIHERVIDELRRYRDNPDYKDKLDEYLLSRSPFYLGDNLSP